MTKLCLCQELSPGFYHQIRHSSASADGELCNANLSGVSSDLLAVGVSHRDTLLILSLSSVSPV